MRELRRVINRPVETSGGTKLVEELSEFAFDSLEDALSSMPMAVIRPEDAIPDFSDLNRMYSRRVFGPTHWLGSDVRNPSDYFRMLRTGAPAIRDRMLAMMEQVQLPDAALRPELTQRRKRTRGDFGNEVDIHRIYQGRADVAWDRTITEKVMTHGNRLVHVVIDISAPLLVNADESLWLGAAVMRIYEALIRMGCSVAISVYGGSVGLWHKHMVDSGMASILVKDYGAPLREEQLALVTHLACFRTMIVSLMSIEGRSRGLDGGMGYATSDYSLRVHGAEDDERRGGSVITVGKAFNRSQAERLVHDFVENHVFGEIAEGKTARQLYGLLTDEEEGT